MPKDYRIKFILDDSQANAAFKRSIANMDAVERAAKKNAAAAQAAGTASANAQVAASAKVTAAAKKSAAERLKAENDLFRNHGVLIGRLQTDGLKLQDRLASAAQKSAAEQTAAAEKSAAKQTTAAKKSAADRLKAENDLFKNHGVLLGQLQASGFKVHDQLAKANEVSTKKQAADAKKASADRLKAENDLFKNQGVLIGQLQASGLKLQTSLTRAAEKGAKDRQRIFDKAASDEMKREIAQEQFARGPHGRAAYGGTRRILTGEEVKMAAANRAVDTLNARAVKARLAMMNLGSAFEEAVARAIGFSGASTIAGTAALGVGAAAAGIFAVSKAFSEAKANAEGFGKSTLEFMVRLRPLAAVMSTTPNRAFAQKIAQFGVATGMSKEQGASFLETFAGRAQITKGKQISDSEYEKFATQAGRLTTARGAPTEAAGDLMASVLKLENFQAKGQGAKEATARAGAALAILDAGSGKIPELVPQAVQMIAGMASENELEGVFRNVGEVAVMTSLMAENNPAEAAVFGRATIKALSQFGDKDRQAFYKKAGIVPGMPGLERVQRANKVFEEDIKKGIPIETILEKYGLAGDVREKTGLMTAFKARNTVLKPQLDKMDQMMSAQGAAETEKYVAERFKDEDVRFTVGEAAVDAAKLQPDTIPLKLWKQKAEEKLVRQGLDTTVSGGLSSMFMSALTFGQGMSGRERIIESEAVRMAQEAAGVTPYHSITDSLFGNASQQISDLQKTIEKNTQALEAARGAKVVVPPAVPLVKAPAGNLRPGN